MDTSRTINPNDLFSAKGLVIAITGGGSGIGLALASALSQTSAQKVYLLGRRLPVLTSAAQSLSTSQTTVVPLECDVTSPSSLAAAAAHIQRETGYLDVLINNAGTLGPLQRDIYSAQSVEELQKAMLLGTEDGGWADTFAVNTTAVVGASAAFLGLLDAGNVRRGWEGGKVGLRETRKRRREEGIKAGVEEGDERSSQIVTVASISGFNRHVTAGLAYTASKAGAVMLGKTLATLLAPWGIRSNVIAPGVYPSDMTAGSKDVYPVNEVPAGRKGDFGDMAGVILYLVGKSGAYVNGNVQVTDGGRLSMMPGTY
ncbi:hypothetical protein H2201_005066 [Coniosporium apollinis]|uniref:NAD(P)-binding protein n=2 Tax=Coniosporium TaxID=2810619 RepID=A0ABQ9NR16_9PEZI|nr:hypothetical protein H2199_000717 [Cladosporium sp. JES 115]KAJ9664845.1 hypothetical protein H2201_005066 [Coniosporium apollinis]